MAKRTRRQPPRPRATSTRSVSLLMQALQEAEGSPERAALLRKMPVTCEVAFPGCRNAADHEAHPPAKDLAATPDLPQAVLDALVVRLRHESPDFTAVMASRTDLRPAQRVAVAAALRADRRGGDAEFRVAAYLALLADPKLPVAALDELARSVVPTKEVLVALFEHPAATNAVRCAQLLAMVDAMRNTDSYFVDMKRSRKARQALADAVEVGPPVVKVAATLARIPVNPPWSPRLLARRSQATAVRLGARLGPRLAILDTFVDDWTGSLEQLLDTVEAVDQ